MQNITQLSLFEPITQPEYEPELTIEQRFERFHEANPHIARRLAEMAMNLRNRGKKRYSMKGLFEVLRFNYDVQTDDEPFKLNNNYTALYARLLMREMPQLEGFFETRERRSD